MYAVSWCQTSLIAGHNVLLCYFNFSYRSKSGLLLVNRHFCMIFRRTLERFRFHPVWSEQECTISSNQLLFFSKRKFWAHFERKLPWSNYMLDLKALPSCKAGYIAPFENISTSAYIYTIYSGQIFLAGQKFYSTLSLQLKATLTVTHGLIK